MNENENKYLSLKTAASLYGYTRDHLGLMIRQGKLKGIKLGSYYVTTGDWMADYLKNHADPDHPATAGKFSNKFLTQVFAAEENLASCSSAKKPKDKIPQTSVQDEFKGDFLRDIQKELLPSLRELSAASEKTDALPTSSIPDRAIFGNPYVILPIREMKESERKEIINKISEYSESKSRQETV